MRRSIMLARLGSGHTAPNPRVGAVLVHRERIIGEGYHQEYGGPHAEVNCIGSVAAQDRPLIPASTLFVTLEPCAHFGKTPPCADLIIREGIPEVVIGSRDPFMMVAGRGIQKLEQAGVRVTTGLLEKECRELNKRFFHFHTMHRPYVILKWAETADHKMASGNTERLMISNPFTNRLVHKWRTEEMAIMVGTNTALLDDPQLSVRWWTGKNPVRILIDRELKIPSSARMMDGTATVIVFNLHQHSLPEKTDLNLQDNEKIFYYQVTSDVSMVHQVMNALYRMNIQSILVEGGAQLLQSFIDENSWDEARVITNEQLTAANGLPAPELKLHPFHTEPIFTDTLRYYRNQTAT